MPMMSRQVATEVAAIKRTEILFIFIIYNSKLIILIIMKASFEVDSDGGNPEVTYINT